MEVLTVSTKVRLTGLTAAGFDDDAKEAFATAVAATLDSIDAADITNLVVTDAQDDDEGGRRRLSVHDNGSRRLTSNGVDVSFDIVVRVDTYTGTGASSADDTSASAFSSIVDDLSTAVQDGGLVASLGNMASFAGKGVSVDTAAYEPPTSYTMVVYAAPTAVPTAFAEEAVHVDAAAAFFASPIGLGVAGGLLVGLAGCYYLCRPETEHERRRAEKKKWTRAKNASRAWEEDVDPWDADLPTSPLHGATNERDRRLEPSGDGTPAATPGGLFSGWHISNFVRSRSRSPSVPSSARSWRSPGSARSAGGSARSGSFFSWFLGGGGGGDGVDGGGDIDEVEMQAQRTPLAEDMEGEKGKQSSIWCEPQDGEEEEDEEEFAPLSPSSRSSRRGLGAGKREPMRFVSQ